jgi:hypothetical protein
MDRFDLIEVTVHVVTSIKSNLSMWSPVLNQTCPCGHLYWFDLNRGEHMDRFDLIEVTTWTGFT